MQVHAKWPMVTLLVTELIKNTFYVTNELPDSSFEWCNCFCEGIFPVEPVLRNLTNTEASCRAFISGGSFTCNVISNTNLLSKHIHMQTFLELQDIHSYLFFLLLNRLQFVTFYLQNQCYQPNLPAYIKSTDYPIILFKMLVLYPSKRIIHKHTFIKDQNPFALTDHLNEVKQVYQTILSH